MLLPTTSIFVWCAWRPEMAGNSERSMGGALRSGVRGRRREVLGADLRDAADVDAGAADLRRGGVGGGVDRHRGDRPGLRAAIRGRVRHGAPDERTGRE